jgi:D-alanyl-D-alanine carboxypeptidase
VGAGLPVGARRMWTLLRTALVCSRGDGDDQDLMAHDGAAPRGTGGTSGSSLDVVLEATAAGRLLPGVRQCLLRVERPGQPDGWFGAVRDGGAWDGPTERSIFRIASVTKVVTATALLALRDRRRCQLEDSIGRYLPAELVERVHVLDGRSHGAEITLRQLLDHTSGLRNFFGEPAIAAAIVDGRGRRQFRPIDLLDVAVEGAPSFVPGTGREYTDTGFLLAGMIIEQIAQAPLHVAYRDLVLDPAGMGDTWLESSDEPPRGGPIMAHEFQGRDITGMDVTVDWAGGGLVSTAADLAALLRALRDGHLLSAGAWAEMTRWSPGPPGFYDDYGLGLGRYRIGATQLIGHHGVWGAFAFWSPELDAVITGTVNTGRIDRRPLLAAVAHALAA